MNLLRKLKDRLFGPRYDYLLDYGHTQYDAETLDDDAAWIDEAAHQDPNDGPGRIHIIHNGTLGYRFWYTNQDGMITSDTGYRTEGKAWRAALAEQDQDAAIDDDYPN